MGDSLKKALIITSVSGFLSQFELHNVKTLQDLGFEVHFASDFNNPFYEFDKEDLIERGIICHQIEIDKSPYVVKRNLKAYKQVKQIIDSEQIDLVHCHNPVGGMLGRMSSSASRSKPYVIYTVHGFHFFKGAPLKNRILFYSAEKYMAHKTDMIITINEEDLQNAKKLKIKKGGVVRRIFGAGVDSKKFREMPEIRQEVREELGIPNGAFHIVTAAELNDNKNHQVVIKALNQIKNKNIYYTLCGAGNNFQKLQDMIDQLGLSDRIHLIGFRKDMDRILQSADCFAFPSLREGLGIAAVEALLCGIPVVAADNRGTREYVIDGQNGIVCRLNTPEEYVDAFTKLSDTDYRNTLAQNCRRSALKFSKENTIEKMQECYILAKEIIEKR